MKTKKQRERARNLEKRNKQIAKEFVELVNDGRTTLYALDKLHKKYFLQPDTVEKIVKGW